MSQRPPFDPQRAAFLILFFVIAVYALVVLGLTGVCIWHSDMILKSDKDLSCDPYNRLMGLLAGALSAALALVGIRMDKSKKDDNADDKGAGDKPP